MDIEFFKKRPILTGVGVMFIGLGIIILSFVVDVDFIGHIGFVTLLIGAYIVNRGQSCRGDYRIRSSDEGASLSPETGGGDFGGGGATGQWDSEDSAPEDIDFFDADDSDFGDSED